MKSSADGEIASYADLYETLFADYLEKECADTDCQVVYNRCDRGCYLRSGKEADCTAGLEMGLSKFCKSGGGWKYSVCINWLLYGIIGAVTLLLLIVAVAFLLYRRKKKKLNKAKMSGITGAGTITPTGSNTGTNNPEFGGNPNMGTGTTAVTGGPRY